MAILDADKEGFLRSERSLVQTIGRAARNENGQVIMYADVITQSMKNAIDETNRRRGIQMAYNEEHGIVPKTIKKEVRDLIRITHDVQGEEREENLLVQFKNLSKMQREEELERLTMEMKEHAKNMNFEAAAELRDIIMELKVAYGHKLNK